MTKQKLYGNNSEPCCETCALGKRSSDGKTVLCRRAGAVPLYHHCRHFVYDPLRRTPHRDQPLEAPDPSAFSLDELDELTAPAADEPAVQDADSAAIVARLRDYLKTSDNPDVATILSLLNEGPAKEAEAPREPTAEEQKLLDEIESTIAAPSERTSTFDDSDDIFEDLQQMDLDRQSFKRAAFRLPDFELPDDGEDEEPLDDPRFADLASSLDATATLSPDENDDEDTPLSSEDLILLNTNALADDPDNDEELVLNPDGTISVKKK